MISFNRPRVPCPPPVQILPFGWTQQSHIRSAVIVDSTSRERAVDATSPNSPAVPTGKLGIFNLPSPGLELLVINLPEAVSLVVDFDGNRNHVDLFCPDLGKTTTVARDSVHRGTF